MPSEIDGGHKLACGQYAGLSGSAFRQDADDRFEKGSKAGRFSGFLVDGRASTINFGSHPRYLILINMRTAHFVYEESTGAYARYHWRLLPWVVG